ncbi:3-hydroxyacyl-CoA dehydrogenase [Altererythrobacter sp. GH1-8]|uniref:3-hydroxyacyl-CoA dehydrogenase n=1 Tax=Altererythrobacter sp. GH1-8 TaxID=3349333 RepID=UPI00374D7130
MSEATEIRKVAIVGAGLIGVSWATVFCAAGIDVSIFDASEEQRQSALGRLDANLKLLRESGLHGAEDAHGKAVVYDQLEDAVATADYVQESVLETIEAKSRVARELDALVGSKTLVGSSSSGIPASAFTEDLANRDRFFVVHPVNPPHLIPVVEIVPAPWSDTAHIPVLRALMEDIGQEPMVVQREIEGFVLNRLQGALLNEAWALYREGYASADDIDRTVRAGLGLRWSLMGPFETIDLNAPGGIADYAARLEPLYQSVAQSRTEPQAWSVGAIARAKEELAQTFAGQSREARARRRDEWLLALKQAKAERD